MILRPHWAQYIISQGFMFLLTVILLLLAGCDELRLRIPLLIISSITTLMMLYGCLFISTLKFVVTAEQLIVEHGVFHRSNDYIELYRVVDFREHRDIMEQLFGLKTISIFGGDRTNPQLDIYGIRESLDLVAIIRERVEYNKQRKGIYEITNR